MKKIYVLMQNYERNFDYAYDIPDSVPCFAYMSKETAEKEMERFLKLNNAGEYGTWQDGDLACYYTIEETDLIEE